MQEKAFEGGGFGSWLTAVACFSIFGVLGLMGGRLAISPFLIGLGVVLGFVFAVVTMKMMAIVLAVANRELRQRYGGRFATWAVRRGMLYLFPFAVLALAADFLLHWPGTMLFASAGIMTAGASVGAELGRLDRPRVKNFLLPAIVAFVMSTAWMVSASTLAMAAGALKTGLGL